MYLDTMLVLAHSQSTEEKKFWGSDYEVLSVSVILSICIRAFFRTDQNLTWSHLCINPNQYASTQNYIVNETFWPFPLRFSGGLLWGSSYFAQMAGSFFSFSISPYFSISLLSFQTSPPVLTSSASSANTKGHFSAFLCEVLRLETWCSIEKVIWECRGKYTPLLHSNHKGKSCTLHSNIQSDEEKRPYPNSNIELIWITILRHILS